MRRCVCLLLTMAFLSASFAQSAATQKPEAGKLGDSAIQVATSPVTPSDAEKIAEAIKLGNCKFLYEYTLKEGADKKLVFQANETLKKYKENTCPNKWQTENMDTRVAAVPTKLMAEVFVDPEKVLPDVVANLTYKITDRFQKAKILHDWICQHIAYDTEMRYFGKEKDQDYASVLKNKKAVCAGYSALMQQMCTLAGIEAICVSGLAKKSYAFDGKASVEGHAWNALHIGSKWYLVDVTWDAGVVEYTTFIKQYTTDWLFLDSRSFLYSHLPDNDREQYYAPVLSEDDFVREVYVGGTFFRLGLYFKDSAPKNYHEIDAPFSVKLGMKNMKVFVDNVVRDRQREDIPNAAWSERQKEVLALEFDVPDKNIYNCQIFAGISSGYKPRFKIKIDLFENTYLPAAEKLYDPEKPKSSPITDTELEFFKSSYFKVEDNNCYYYREDQFETNRINAVLKLHRLLNIENNNSLDYVLGLQVKASPAYAGFGIGYLKYPYRYSGYHEAVNVKLISPLKGTLKAGAEEQFVIVSPDPSGFTLSSGFNSQTLIKNPKTGNYEVTLTIPDNKDELVVYNRYNGLLRYKIEK